MEKDDNADLPYHNGVLITQVPDDESLAEAGNETGSGRLSNNSHVSGDINEDQVEDKNEYRLENCSDNSETGRRPSTELLDHYPEFEDVPREATSEEDNQEEDEDDVNSLSLDNVSSDAYSEPYPEPELRDEDFDTDLEVDDDSE